MRRTFVATIAALALLGAVPSADSAAAGYHWRGTGERSVDLVASVVTESWTSAFVRAQADWAKSRYIAFDVTDGNTDLDAREACRVTDDAIHVCVAHYSAGWAGLTEVTYDSGSKHVLRGRVRLNARLVNSGPTRRAVTCHELGHAIGLGHRSQSSGSCMRPVVSGSVRTPNRGDYRTLKNVYSHSHGTAAGADVADETVEVVRDDGREITVRITSYL